MKKLKELCEDFGYTVLQGSLDKDITGVFYDSRKVTDKSLFVCIEGAVSDGHKFAAKAIVNKPLKI